jgi:hypothetical protein
MPTINVTVKGPSRDAKLSWDAKNKPFRFADDVYTAVFDTPSGDHNYAITIAGAPGEGWSATVSGGVKKHKHAGHVSSAGVDTTGDTPYEV